MKMILVQGFAFYGVNAAMVTDEKAALVKKNLEAMGVEVRVGSNGEKSAQVQSKEGDAWYIQEGGFHVEIMDNETGLVGEASKNGVLGRFSWDTGVCKEGNALLDELLK